MHKPILRRVGLVLVVASLLQVAWVIYRSAQTSGFAIDLTFLVSGICLMFGSLKTARFILRLAVLTLVLLIGVVAYWMVAGSFGWPKPGPLTWETAGDFIDYVLWAILCAWTVRELSRPEILADGEIAAPQEPSATSAGRPVRYRRARADP